MRYYEELANITVYVDNNTLLSNSNINLVNDNIKAQKWYKQAVGGRGRILWRYGERDLKDVEFLYLVRSIYNNDGKLVGVLTIDINYNNLRAILNDDPDNIIALDNRTISLNDNIDFTKYLQGYIIEKSNSGNSYISKSKFNGADDYIVDYEKIYNYVEVNDIEQLETAIRTMSEYMRQKKYSEEEVKIIIIKIYLELREKVGYKNLDYFHSKFKKYVGISPLNYKKHNNKEV